MTSIWKDLLFLHGHLVNRDDLIWSSEAAPKPDERDALPALSAATAARAPQDCGKPACA